MATRAEVCLSCGSASHVTRTCPLINKVRSLSLASNSSLDSNSGGLGFGFGFGSARNEQPSPFLPITEVDSSNKAADAGAVEHAEEDGGAEAAGAVASTSSSTTARRRKKKRKAKKKAMSHDLGADLDDLATADCFNCGQQGHLSRDCTRPRCCFLCGDATHVAKNCELSALKDGSRPDSNASSLAAAPTLSPPSRNALSPLEIVDEQQQQCQQQQQHQHQQGGKQLCLNCNEAGHRLKNCPHARSCFFCGVPGHVAQRCPSKPPPLSTTAQQQQQQSVGEASDPFLLNLRDNSNAAHRGSLPVSESAPATPRFSPSTAAGQMNATVPSPGTQAADLKTLGLLQGAARTLFGGGEPRTRTAPPLQLQQQHSFSGDAAAFVPASLRAPPGFSNRSSCASEDDERAGSASAARGYGSLNERHESGGSERRAASATANAFAFSPVAGYGSEFIEERSASSSMLRLPGLSQSQPSEHDPMREMEQPSLGRGGAFSAFAAGAQAQQRREQLEEAEDAEMQHHLVGSLLD